MNAHTIAVRTGSVRYDVHIAPGILAEVASLTDRLLDGALTAGQARAFIVTSPQIWELWGPVFAAGFSTPATVLFVEPGEQHKRFATLESLAEQLAEARADRDSVLFALGGGVLGDLTGFLAAIYMRGIRYIQVPTTLLAQVDSALGGKTGANLAAGKNLIGAFHHPIAVFADPEVLRTLPPRELRAGLQESIKAGIIRDPELFAFLESHSTDLAEIITRSIQVKATVVANDERELGERMLLNLGHTLGHAIEAATHYTQLLHGEAVAWGMLAATAIAKRRGLVTDAEHDRIERVIKAYGPLKQFHADAAELVALTATDKKNRSGSRSFVLPPRHRRRRHRQRRQRRRVDLHRRAHDDNGRPGRCRMNPSAGARTANEPDEQTAAREVRALFNTIAPTYDRLNHLLSVGLDRHWWRSTARSFRSTLANPEARILDICCGTGDMTAALAAERPAAAEPITGLDFSPEMLDRARTKYASGEIVWVEGDAMHLPFPDNSFDLITAAFGFRNLTNYAAGLRELHRVLAPNGQLGILECNQPKGIRGIGYNLYLHHGLPLIGGWISGEREAYRYLPASIARFPRPPQMLAMLNEAGFADSHWRGFFLHAAGLYTARKP